MSTELVDVFSDVGKQLTAKMPGYAVEVSAVPGVAEFNAAMAAKLAAGDPPDIFVYQWGTQIQLYAKGGNVLDLTSSNLIDRIRPIRKPYNVYQGKVYALPLVQSVWGVYYNKGVAQKYGYTSDFPKTWDKFLAMLDTLQKAGLKEPIVIAGADGSGATAFTFGYLHTVVSGKNPDFYMQTLEGTKTWNGQEWRDLFTAYGQLMKYTAADKLGLSIDDAERRFAKGDAVIFFNGSGVLNTIRKLNPDANFTLEPAPYVTDEKDWVAMSDYDSAISISSKTKYPEAALAFFDLLFTPENGNKVAKALSSLSSVKGATATFDPALSSHIPLIEAGKFVGYSEREWIPGIKEIMKKATQDWMAGTDLDTVLNRLEAEHQRLLAATPSFKADYFELRANMK